MRCVILVPPLAIAATVTARLPFQNTRVRSRLFSPISKPLSGVIFPRASCEPAEPSDTVTDRLNELLSTGGPGYILSLCPNQNYLITAPLEFTAPGQEIRTEGLPTDDSRAMLTVSGPISDDPDGDSHTTAVTGQCTECNDIKLGHVQINGSRNGGAPVGGGANIEMGGNTTGQLVEYVRSFDPRSWSCLHMAEGGLKCTNATVQNNDIGPCGSDNFNEWADGLSIACANTIVRNNLVNTPTDGGIVLFGSPGSLVENNTIWVESNTLLGGINMVDYDPWSGDYQGTIVRQNKIIGGLATDSPTSPSDNRGTNNDSVIIKIGIAIGPHTWFGDHYLANVSQGGTVLGNEFEGAFGYAIAVTSVSNFMVQSNVLVGNTSFIGSRGPNCSDTDQTPNPQPFVAQLSSVSNSLIQTNFQNITDGDSLNCIVPPPGGDYWPFGGKHSPESPPPVPGQPTLLASNGNSGMSVGKKVAIAISVVAAVLLVAFLFWFARRRQRQYWQAAGKPGSQAVMLPMSSTSL